MYGRVIAAGKFNDVSGQTIVYSLFELAIYGGFVESGQLNDVLVTACGLMTCSGPQQFLVVADYRCMP